MKHVWLVWGGTYGDEGSVLSAYRTKLAAEKDQKAWGFKHNTRDDLWEYPQTSMWRRVERMEVL